MISIEQARKIVAEAVPARQAHTIPLPEAAGRYLAGDVDAREPVPGFDNSAMDGYAVTLASPDEDRAPVQLPVVGEARAGGPHEALIEQGTAVKISTGAAVPEGTGRVIPVEQTTEQEGTVTLNDLGADADNIRFQGEEVTPGEVVARAGEALTPPVIGQLAGLGVDRVRVVRPPRVAVLTTGAELVPVDAPLGPGQIRNTNRYALEALLAHTACSTPVVETVPDEWMPTVRAVEQAAAAADVVIVTGGVSVGPHDHVKAAAQEAGFEQQFWKVRQKPGKPLFFATRGGGEDGDTLLFGLPGNPFSALINALVYVYPVLRELGGVPRPGLAEHTGQLAHAYDRLKPGRAKFLLVRFTERRDGTSLLEVVERQRSHMLSGLSAADGFIRTGADRERVDAGERFAVRCFPWTDVRV